MPKGKKKGKYEHRRTEVQYSSDEDAVIDTNMDNCSEISGQSDLKSNVDDAGMEPRPERDELFTNKISTSDTLDRAIQLAEEVEPSACMGLKEMVRPQAKVVTVRPQGKGVTAPFQSMKVSASGEPTVHKGYPDPALRQRTTRVWPYTTLPVHLLECTPAVCRIRKYKCQDCRLQRSLRQKKGQLAMEGTDGDDNENEIQEKQEEKVLEIIEALSARSNAARATAFVALRAALQRRAFDTLLCNHRATLADHISRAIRRGKDGERKAAAAVTPLVALQIGEEGTEEFVAEVRPALIATVTDKSASLDTRTECCSSLAVLCYLMEDDVTEILEVMRVYESVFSGSYLKGDGSVKVSGAVIEEGALHAAALDAWALLLALLAPQHALQLLRTTPPSLQRLADLLEVPSLDVRMAAGGALAMAYESVCVDEPSEDAELAPHVAALLPRLAELARDSHKYRAKRDRKVQRATFRDILKYFEEGSVPAASARVGAETAAWSSWSGAAAYGALAAALGGALAALAARSALLRAALALPDLPPGAARPRRKLNKLQRHLQNNAACKARTLARNKNRDKRSAALAI